MVVGGYLAPFCVDLGDGEDQRENRLCIFGPNVLFLSSMNPTMTTSVSNTICMFGPNVSFMCFLPRGVICSFGPNVWVLCFEM